jgi:hypothetical protein
VLAERAGEGAEDVVKTLSQAGFDIAGRPYEAFVKNYFAGTV